MNRFQIRARLIALTVAYALAMQGLLSAFAAPAVGAGLPGTGLPGMALCAVIADASGEVPPSERGADAHDCDACVLGGCAAAAILAPETVCGSIGPDLVTGTATGVAPSALATIRTPQIPRAPPTA